MTEKKNLFEGWNSVPNIVTYVRIVLMVAFIYFAIAAGPFGVDNITNRWIAAILFIIAASTDKLDGFLARKYNQVTELGKLMDPIADKLLICGAFLVLSFYGEIWWWLTILFLVREIGITIMRFFVIDTGGQVIAASSAGKLKTLTQCIGLGMILLPMWTVMGGFQSTIWVNYYWIGTIILLLALFFCLYSGGEYLINTFSARPQKEATETVETVENN
ncbi:CDP-diacylglycerol--glycerol-3-phosphate 3-phosphatidyltransferase [Alloscardovia criceti]|uniref:CDP-diacylglycerol--glycerol-3-phosphate 3-phosphatidyltransferase n=1 Tax=Alloscardovia criceti TaxID=356828 RepID=UPI0003764022|nr:CDP-diacylglycerol--glycerol-3-phosphate 3-phosphatidyltransferase [Alloscardovia criceti]